VFWCSLVEWKSAGPNFYMETQAFQRIFEAVLRMTWRYYSILPFVINS